MGRKALVPCVGGPNDHAWVWNRSNPEVYEVDPTVDATPMACPSPHCVIRAAGLEYRVKRIYEATAEWLWVREHQALVGFEFHEVPKKMWKNWRRKHLGTHSFRLYGADKWSYLVIMSLSNIQASDQGVLVNNSLYKNKKGVIDQSSQVRGGDCYSATLRDQTRMVTQMRVAPAGYRITTTSEISANPRQRYCPTHGVTYVHAEGVCWHPGEKAICGEVTVSLSIEIAKGHYKPADIEEMIGAELRRVGRKRQWTIEQEAAA